MVCYKLNKRFYKDNFNYNNIKDCFDVFSGSYYSNSEPIFKYFDIPEDKLYKMVLSGKYAVVPISINQSIEQIQNYYNNCNIQSILVRPTQYKQFKKSYIENMVEVKQETGNIKQLELF